MMNRYGTRTAAQKLGIVEGSTVAVLNPPRNLTGLLSELPAHVEFTEQHSAVTLCFGITGTLVREAALDLGLVDYKICSLGKDWTGMLFAATKP